MAATRAAVRRSHPTSGRSQVFQDSAVLTAASLLGQAETVFASIMLARRGGPNGFGTISIALGIVALLTDVSDFGSTTWAVREVSRGEMGHKGVIFMLRWRLALTFLIAVVGICLTVVFQRPNLSLTCLFAVYFCASCLSVLTMGLCRAQLRILRAACATLTERTVLAIVAVLGFAFHWQAPLTFAAGFAIGAIVGLLVCLRQSIRLPVCGSEQYRSILGIYRASLAFGISGLASDLSNLEAPLVGYFGGLTVAGNFAAANRLSGPLGLPASAISSVLFPRLSRLEFREGRELGRRAYRYLLPIAGVVFILIVTSGKLIPLILGRTFGNGTTVCINLILMSVVVGSANQISYCRLQAAGAQRAVSGIVVACMLTGLFACGIGSYSLGARGAACGVLSKELVTFVNMQILLRRWNL